MPIVAAIQKWASAQRGWAHSIAALIAVCVFEYASDPDFHARALRLWSKLPGTVQDVLVLVVLVGAIYLRSGKQPMGSVQESQPDVKSPARPAKEQP